MVHTSRGWWGGKSLVTRHQLNCWKKKKECGNGEKNPPQKPCKSECFIFEFDNLHVKKPKKNQHNFQTAEVHLQSLHKYARGGGVKKITKYRNKTWLQNQSWYYYLKKKNDTSDNHNWICHMTKSKWEFLLSMLVSNQVPNKSLKKV